LARRGVHMRIRCLWMLACASLLGGLQAAGYSYFTEREEVVQAEREAAAALTREYEEAAEDEKLDVLLRHAGSRMTRVAIRVARWLGNHDDPRAIRALEAMRDDEYAVNINLTGMMPSVYARRSLEHLASYRDLERMPEADLKELEAIVRKYALPRTNITANAAIQRHLLERAEEDPDAIVRLLVVYYPYSAAAKTAADRYPERARRALAEAMHTLDPIVMRGLANLVRELRADEYLDDVFGFMSRGMRPYSRDEVSGAAMSAGQSFGSLGIDAFAKALYSGDAYIQRRALTRLAVLGSREAYEVVLEFEARYNAAMANPMIRPDTDIRASIDETKRRIEENLR